MKRERYISYFSDKLFPHGKATDSFAFRLSMVLLFIISFVYFYGFGNYIFFYQENNSLFIFSAEYFQKFAVKPGGLLVYASNFLAQWYFSYLYGSLLLSALLVMLCAVLKEIYDRMLAVSNFFLIFVLVPSCGLLLLQTSFDLFLQYDLGYLLVAVWFLVSIFPQKKILRMVLLVLFPLFYYLVGSFAMIYLGMYILYCIFFEKGIPGILPAILIIIAGLTFFLFKEVIFLQPVDQYLGYPLSFYDSSMITLFLGLLGGFIVLFPVFITTSGEFKVNQKLAQVIPVTTIVIIFTVLIFVLCKFYDPALQNLMKIEKSVYKQDWDAVIRLYERNPMENVFGQYYYNLALSEKGQLCDRLFFGPQSFGPVSLTLTTDLDQADKTIYFYYNIGLIGEAHHLAYELMVVNGYRADNIKMLIKTELINGNYKIAQRYINVLKRTSHFREWAERIEKMNFSPALIHADAELGEKLRTLPKRDFFIGSNDIQNIDTLLKINPHNKKAFEYKMARLLLEKDFIEVANEARKMKEMGYTKIPRHIEEAVLELISVTKEIPDLGGLTLTPECEKRFIQYLSDYNAYNKDRSLLEKHMTKAEKNTFWYYLQNKSLRSDFLKSKPEDNSIY